MVIKKLNIERQKTARPVKRVKSWLQKLRPTSRFIRSSANGQRYFVAPIPNRNTILRVLVIGLVLAAAVVVARQAYRYFGPHNYALSNAASILTDTNDTLANGISFDNENNVYRFTHGTSAGTADIKQTGATAVAATLPVKANQGLTVTDPNYKIDLSLSPKFAVADGKQEKNRIVYPFRNHEGWLVYTATGSGIKEDIVLAHKTSDSRSFQYDMKLPDGTEARLESDGSIGVYGNQIFMNSITPATDADATLLQRAQEKAEKNLLLFTIPAPVVIESDRQESVVEAEFQLDRHKLTVTATNLNQANYPLSIDPSIYIVTAQQFMNGNNETNIDFDVTNKLIKKAPTTGARFDKWNSTMPMNTTKWRQGVAVAGGYIYTVGGVHPEGGSAPYSTAGTDTFVVPDGITAITVKAWGAGGGGGGGGNGSLGGVGGAGGFSTSTISVTPNELLTVSVGGGGGGGGGGNSGAGGGGGGYSGVSRGSTRLVIAGGGAGGGGGGTNGSNVGGAGGAGGGESGQDGWNSGTSGGGGGGTQYSGGAGGAGSTNRGSPGSWLQGGDGGDGRNSTWGADGGANNGGTSGGGNGGARDVSNRYAGAGGGGGGYYGGGGGTGSTSRTGAAGGGGGSSYATGVGISTLAGDGDTPGNADDSDRGEAGNPGQGASSTRSTGESGSNGLVIITYVSDTSATNTVEWAKFNTTDGTIESTNPGAGSCGGWCTSSQYNLPSPRGKPFLVAYNGFLYAMGGEDNSCTVVNGTGDNGICSTVFVAKIGANGEPQLWHPTDKNKANWTYWYRDNNLSSPRSGFIAAAYNNRLYLTGGMTSNSGSSSIANTVQIADLTPDGRLSNWSNATDLPAPTYGHTSLVYNNRIYLVGGASSIGGAPRSNVYYNRINADGTLNSWQQTTSMPSGRMSNGGNFGAVWGAYLYVTGGCSDTNSSSYCRSIASDTQVASINADGSLDSWNSVGGVADTRTGHNVVGWGGYIYEIGGCSSQDPNSGMCTNALSDIQFGKINQDGDASTVGETSSYGTAACSGSDPANCDLPGTQYIGNMLTNAFISNGYLYLVGGCTNNGCSSTSRNTAYTAISSTGTMVAPASCPSPRTIRDGIWCVDTSNITPNGIAASSPVVFNGRIYLVGGLTGSGNSNSLFRADLDQADGSIGGWTEQSLSGWRGLGVNNVSFQYAFARANPSEASVYPGNLYILGGCTASTGAGCTSYSQNVYKCDIRSNGEVDNCSTNGQLRLGTVPGATGTGLGIMSGTVYANYIYLIGGVSPGLADLDTVRYAKIDDNNNIVAASGTSWIESVYKMSVGRRRSAAFGYNGYLYAVGGYEAATGVLPDIEFIKINVSDGSLVEGWKVSAVKINQRWGLTVPVSNSYAYVIGGCTVGASPSNCTTRTDVIQTFQIYNNDSGTPAKYSNSANSYTTNQQRLGGSAVVLNGHIYMAGGCTGSTDCSSPIDTVSSAPIDSNGAIGAWADQAPLPEVRGWGKLAVAGNTLYYLGGQDASGTAKNSVYYATPNGSSVSSWATATNGLPSARTKFGVASWNNRIYVVGGASDVQAATNTVYVSPQLNNGGDIAATWSTSSDSLPVARNGHATVAYANNLYVFGGVDASGNYLSDTSFTQINTANGNGGTWHYSTTLPKPIANADAIAANGYIYLIGGRDSPTACVPSTLIAPVSANTAISAGNIPTGVGEWSATNQRFSGGRYGAAAVYNDGKLYVLGGGCGGNVSYPSAANTVQQTTLLSQPQVAEYSIMIDTDSDVFPSVWLMNGVDNSVGAMWKLKYRSMSNQQTDAKCANMATWGQTTNFGNITLGTPGQYIVKDDTGADVKCGRYFYFNVTVDSSQAYGYPDDVSRGPTINDLTLQFTADPSKRLMHGRTFTGGIQMPNDTPQY